jgi:hypothetical protein
VGDDELLSAEDALEAVAAIADEVAEQERELDAAVRTAASLGVSVRAIAEATGASKSSVQRRLASETDEADVDEELREARLTLAKLKLTERASRVRIRNDNAALIEEANALTRITPADLRPLT